MRTLLLGLLLLTIPALAEPLTIQGFTFDAPMAFSEPVKLGVDAFSATAPPEADYDQVDLEVIVVQHSAGTVEVMEEGDGPGVGRQAVITYLGLYKEPEQINKTLFLEGTSAREVYTTSVPRKATVHVFSKRLDDGGFLMVAVRDFGSTGTGDVLRAIANTGRLEKP